jgi:hypothetical protein
MERSAAACRLGIVVATMVLTGCEYVASDVATRIRYALQRSLASPPADGQTTVVRLRPDHWPDACPGDGGYTLKVTPYRGGKQVPTGDILIACRGRGSYATGLGSERIAVAAELTIEKTRAQDLEIEIRGRAAGIEIVALH